MCRQDNAFPGHTVSVPLLSRATALAEVAEELAKVILAPRWPPSPSPDGQECYEAENSAPGGVLNTWHGLNHEHSRPLGQAGLSV